MAFTCPYCGRTSHHPVDARERYCGACHLFVDEQAPDTKPLLSIVHAHRLPPIQGDDSHGN